MEGSGLAKSRLRAGSERNTAGQEARASPGAGSDRARNGLKGSAQARRGFGAGGEPAQNASSRPERARSRVGAGSEQARSRRGAGLDQARGPRSGPRRCPERPGAA